MIGGRLLNSAIKNAAASTLNLAIHQKPWNSTFALSSRALSSLKPTATSLPSQQKQVAGNFTDANLIGRRFFNRGSYKDESSGKSSLMTALVAAFGGLLAVGGGAAYHSLMDGESSFDSYYRVDCACDDQCGNKNKCCVDKKCDESPCLRKMDCEEENIMKANAELERVLKDIKSKAIEYTEAAMKAYCEAIELMQKYLDQGYCVIDNDELEPPAYEEAWCCVYDIAKKRCEKVKEALEKGQCAWELLCRLREVIEQGKECKYTKCNPLLVTAEEALCCAEKELLTLKAKMDCVSSDHDMVDQYRDVIEDFKKDLKVDIEAMMECCDIQYAEQEVALMITAAYKRAIRAQKDMAQVLVCNGKVPDRLQQTCC